MAKSKKPAKKALSKNLSETSNPSLKAIVTDDLLKQVRSRSKSERQEIGDAINRVLESWGRPHANPGIGIRRLTKTNFECWESFSMEGIDYPWPDWHGKVLAEAGESP